MLKKIIVSAAIAAFAPAALAAQESTQEFNERVYDALRANPKIMHEVQELYYAQLAKELKERQSENVERLYDILAKSKIAVVSGNPSGETTLIEFFDYNCGFCRKAAPVVEKLKEDNPDLKVVSWQFPILAQSSDVAATASLAAYKQDKYDEFHIALMSIDSPVTESIIFDVAEEAGLDIEKMKADMRSDDVRIHIEAAKSLAKELEVNGTPAWVIGKEVVPGYKSLDEMQKLLNKSKE